MAWTPCSSCFRWIQCSDTKQPTYLMVGEREEIMKHALQDATTSAVSRLEWRVGITTGLCNTPSFWARNAPSPTVLIIGISTYSVVLRVSIRHGYLTISGKLGAVKSRLDWPRTAGRRSSQEKAPNKTASIGLLSPSSWRYGSIIISNGMRVRPDSGRRGSVNILGSEDSTETCANRQSLSRTGEISDG